MQFLRKPRKAWLLVPLALAVIIGLGACSSADEDATTTTPAATEPVEKPLIKMADPQFESIWINNAIIKYIIEEGYGYEVETVESTTVLSQIALANGDFDIWLELWQQNQIDWYNEEIAAGTIENLGMTYEGGPQFFMIPQWVHDQYGIDTVEDMKDNWELFKDPEDQNKGAFYNCIIGWQCEAINEVKIEAYGLDEYYNVISPGASGAMEAALHGAMLKEQPIFGYYWSPTAVMGMYDWYILEEPEYDKDIWDKIIAAKDNPDLRPLDAAVAYETLPVEKGINSGLRDKAPDLVTMLEKANIGLDQINKTAAWAITEEIAGEWKLAAIYYLTNWDSRWKGWVTSDAYNKVKAALAAE